MSEMQIKPEDRLGEVRAETDLVRERAQHVQRTLMDLKSRGADVTKTQVKATIDQIDIDALEEKCDDRVSLKVWDPEENDGLGTFVNSVQNPKEHWPILAEDGARAIMIFQDGKCVQFQYESPQGGIMGEEEAIEQANYWHDQRVSRLLEKELTEAVLDALG